VLDAHAGRRRVAMAMSDPATPGDLWVAGMDGLAEGHPTIAGSSERRLTAANQALLDGVTLSAPERFAYRGADDWTFEGWVIPPVGVDPGKRHPAILSIHGGPHCAYGEAFFFEFQVLAALGYAVVLTNPRGSQGYGQIFTAATHHDWGGKDCGDIMDGLEAALSRYPYLDRAHLGVSGGSYGGFMANWIIGHTDRFKAAVTMRSIANALSQWGTSDMAYFRGYWEFHGDPWDSPTFYWEKSPLAYAKNVTTPLLIEHSENDLRCPIGEAEQIADKVAGSWLVVADNEGHGMAKKENRDFTNAVTVLFFRKHLLELLAEEPRSVSRLARELGLSRGDLEDDLRHMIRSARAAGHRVAILPARCRSCGFSFGEDKLAKPGKCPSCRGSRIFEAQIGIEK
jgi:dipeptidyl aminopeptidase/acylaminoacyl peptidase/predicted Zn-ribbon and HTH transcriptional regulator